MSNAWLFMDILSFLYVLSSTSCSSSTLTLRSIIFMWSFEILHGWTWQARFPFASVLVRVLKKQEPTGYTYACSACVYIQDLLQRTGSDHHGSWIIRSTVSKLETQELMQFLSKSEGLRTRNVDGRISVTKLAGLTSQKSWCFGF